MNQRQVDSSVEVGYLLFEDIIASQFGGLFQFWRPNTEFAVFMVCCMWFCLEMSVDNEPQCFGRICLLDFEWTGVAFNSWRGFSLHEFPRGVSELISVKMLCVSPSLGGTCRNGHVVLRQVGHAHTGHQSKLPWCETSEQELLSFALLTLEWTQNAKVANDPTAVSRLVKARFSVD